jgi:hypothetical protein
MEPQAQVDERAGGLGFLTEPTEVVLSRPWEPTGHDCDGCNDDCRFECGGGDGSDPVAD